jgi:DNA polymerase V
MTKIIGIADCNNFYASCERVFNPAVRNKPVLVLSNNDGNAIARSKEAKDLGIRMGEKIYDIKDLIAEKEIHLFSSNYTLYADMSERVVQAIREFIPVLEIYSIDEVFMDLDHVPENELEDFLLHVKKMVLKWTGIPISIGAAPTKTLAKLANKISKSGNGVYFISNPQKFIEERSSDLEISDVWGIGSAAEKKLADFNCSTLQQFVNLPPDLVKRNLTVTGLRTQMELSGKQCIPLQIEPKRRKNISTGRSFGYATSDFLEVQKAVHLYTKKVVEKLNAESLSAGYFVLHLSNDRHKETVYYSRNFAKKLTRKTNNFEEIWGQVQKLLIQEFKKGIRYRKGSVMLGDLCPAGSEQTSLFIEITKPKRVLEPRGSNWVMRRDYLSKNFTTSWKELPEVNKILRP